tara:strand:- start:23424 stop:23744 length:321 start_codon:yes stop_codon:yes gene_type:complete
MNKLDYSISLREEGLVSDDIKKKMKEEGFEESEIQYYLKKSDKIFLNQLINNKVSKSKSKVNKDMKTMALVLSLMLLISAFFGYIRIGLLGLFIIWGLVGYSSNRK